MTGRNGAAARPSTVTVIAIRPFGAADAEAVRALFIETNRRLAPAGMEAAFRAYVDRIADYYGERGGGFWVAVGAHAGGVVGMFGLEPAAPGDMELRRMYVDPSARRAGVATRMLSFAEAECRRRGMERLVLSTSELQGAALALYRAAGYRDDGSEVASETSNRTVGGGLRRFRFSKALARAARDLA